MSDAAPQGSPAINAPVPPRGSALSPSAIAIQWACVLSVTAVFVFLLFVGGEEEEFRFVGGSAPVEAPGGPAVPNPHGGGSDPHSDGADPHGGQASSPLAQMEKQLQNLRQEAAAKPTDAAVRLQLANSLFNVGSIEKRQGAPDAGRAKWIEAIGYYAEALRLQESPNARCDMGTCFFELGQYGEALREFKNVLANNPDHVNARFNLGMALAAQGDIPGAVQAWEELVRAHPDSPAGKQAKANLEQMNQHK